MERLIDEQGRPQFGWLREPVGRVNYMDFDLRSPMDRSQSRWRRRMAFNQFQFIGIPGQHWTAGVAIVDLKWLSNAFFYVYDHVERRLLEHSLLQPLGWGTQMDNRPDQGLALFRQGRTEVAIRPLAGRRHIRIRHGKDIDWDLVVSVPPPEATLRVCSPAGYSGWSYTQKDNGLDVEGAIRWGDRRFEVMPEQRASIDWSAGFMRRETAWNWASLSGVADGLPVGLNLATGVNESGVTENAIWLDGQLHKVGQARFEFNRFDRSSPWVVTSSDGRVDLRFEPEGYRSERTNALLIATNFRQFYGRFYGRLTTGGGETVAVDGLPGFMEDHYARW
ncbi:DUF2804 domain-containing protein [Marinobacteraceae bacterium S3BR75-40.1]